jgi:hypothetical protein
MKQTNQLAALFNVLIEEGYNFLTIKEGNHYRRYRLVNQRTSCAVIVTEEEIDISLCLLDDIDNKSYASERHVTVSCAEDFSAARELIHRFEDWCDEDAYLYSEE